MVTLAELLRYAQWLEQADPGFLAMVIAIETGKDYRDRDLEDQIACLVELFGLHGVASILGYVSRRLN